MLKINLVDFDLNSGRLETICIFDRPKFPFQRQPKKRPNLIFKIKVPKRKTFKNSNSAITVHIKWEFYYILP